MKDHNRFAEAKGNGMGQFTGMIQSLEATFANVHILTQSVDLPNGQKNVAYFEACCQEIGKPMETEPRLVELHAINKAGPFINCWKPDLLMPQTCHICSAEHFCTRAARSDSDGNARSAMPLDLPRGMVNKEGGVIDYNLNQLIK